jgi:hypothetical protein
MTRLFRFLIAATAVLTAAMLPLPAEAASVVMCRAAASNASAGPSRWTAPGSGTTYSLDNQGCTVVGIADLTDAAAGGFTQSGPVRAFMANTGVWTGTTNILVGNLPASAGIVGIFMTNSTANAVTGGVSIGSTANGTDIVAATACAANCVANSTLVKTGFSLTAPTTINAAPVTAGNNANVTITVLYSYF